MKHLFSVITVFLISLSVFSQAKKPTIMVVPSDNWCITQGYFDEFEIYGTVSKVPNYRQALQESSDLLLVISKINELMASRGFPLKNLESSLKTLEADAAEEAMTMSKGGGEINESPVDALKKVAQADIWMQMTWSINTVGPKRSITFNLQGLDAYTGKQVAGASGTGAQSFTAELPVLLEAAVLNYIDGFNVQLQSHFDDLFENGREITMAIKTWDTWDYDLETEEFGDDELGYIIEDWISDNTVGGVFSTKSSTETSMKFNQVRIPLFNDRGRALDAKKWGRGLSKYLKEEFEIVSKVTIRGLGQVTLTLGEK